MKFNEDVSRRCVLDLSSLPWLETGRPGVKTRLLEQHGEELAGSTAFARSTAIISYRPDTRPGTDVHPRGQEILVLEGIYEDDTGSHAAGSYIRNPPGSAHTSGSTSGCTLFVKNDYLFPEDDQRTVIDTRSAAWYQGLVAGLTVLPLAESGTRHTALVRWAPGTRFNPHRHYGGEEILVLEGVFEDDSGRYPAGTWMRSPHLSAHQPFSIEGCLILVMTGHLLD